MDKKTFFDKLRHDANIAFSKVVDKVEEVSRTSSLSLKINSLKTQSKDLKKQIGDYVFIHHKDFENVDEIKVLTGKIKKIEEEIERKRKQLTELKENKPKN
ncbi:MAG: hypothetical protein Q7J16_05285 [Candidatus Cloacimonadales bacterium]|nr:hypothetical protein [Candidatus Cloacimonadales bacterium]